MFSDLDVIYTYTRANAIADGVLVDLSANFPDECSQLYKYPVAATAAVWRIIEQAVAGDSSNSLKGVVWDLLWMSQKGISKRLDPTQHLFTVIITGAGGSRFERNQHYEFKAMCHPGDTAEPVITILQPDED
jgi:hypothetical protein